MDAHQVSVPPGRRVDAHAQGLYRRHVPHKHHAQGAGTAGGTQVQGELSSSSGSDELAASEGGQVEGRLCTPGCGMLGGL